MPVSTASILKSIAVQLDATPSQVSLMFTSYMAIMGIAMLALFGLTMGQAVVWYTGQFYALFFLTQLLKVDAQTANLLDNPGRRFSEPGNLLTAQGSPTPFTDNLTIEWERFGRRYTGGVRVTF